MSDQKQCCMVMKINVDCNACYRKLRRIVLKMKAIETYKIEKERYRLIVIGRFKPSDIAIKIRKKMNRRVEILGIEEMEPDTADQNPPPPEQIQTPAFPQGPTPNHYQIPRFPSLAANEYRRCRPDFAVTRFPEPDMEERFWHYGYEFAGDNHRDSAYNYYEY